MRFRAATDDRFGYPIAGQKDKGWSLGISADQQITGMIGLFGRFGWNNDDVYVVQWEASGSNNVTYWRKGTGTSSSSRPTFFSWSNPMI